ncbi:GNAT family N-acetyltransferase [Fervidibacillus halotolerans]|uniref:GNAT family N-acetyltransferase n=1 Tax=Fervidibacillus halotolerans TaxID=2980027 RepID=A0A9E8LZU5_9BACI|nr:GNAT family N-acetyltransferase [Fervidibacillus halotolerans]WAA12868.1 GNAT family N-acetyltransferase [Fervidibacillus halotolerans]
MLEIKKIPEEDLEAFAHIVSRAYPAIPLLENGAVEKFTKALRTIQLEREDTNFYGAYENGLLKGGMRLYDFIMNFRGKKIKVGGVGMVAVDLLYKKEKIAKNLIQFFLEWCRDEEKLFALLYPFRPDFYKQMGFGFGTRMEQFKLTPKAFPNRGSKKHVRYLTKDDGKAIKDCYETFTKTRHGMIEKTPFEYKRYFMRSDLVLIGVEVDGKLEGYATFTFKKAHENNTNLNDIHIDEFIYRTPQALNEMFTFFHSQHDQIRRIVFNTQDESFYQVFNDPRSDTDNMIPHVYHETSISAVGLMYRAVNPKILFNKVGDLRFGELSSTVKFEIEDTFDANAQTSFTVQFEQGQPKIVNSNQTADVTLKMTMADFSSMIMGTVTLEKLYEFGCISLSNLDALVELSNGFRTNHKPICNTGF